MPFLGVHCVSLFDVSILHHFSVCSLCFILFQCALCSEEGAISNLQILIFFPCRCLQEIDYISL